jgi:hypothetical protein
MVPGAIASIVAWPVWLKATADPTGSILAAGVIFTACIA